MLFITRFAEKQSASNWILLTLLSWVTLNTHLSVYAIFPMIVIGYLILSWVIRTTNKTVALGTAASLAVSEVLAWLSYWNYGIDYSLVALPSLLPGIDWTIWWDALNRALTPVGVVLALAGVVTLFLYAVKHLPERRWVALILPWVVVPLLGTLGWIYGYWQSRLFLRYFSTMGLPSVVLSTMPFAKLPRKYAVPLYAAFLVYVLFVSSLIRSEGEWGMV